MQGRIGDRYGPGGEEQAGGGAQAESARVRRRHGDRERVARHEVGAPVRDGAGQVGGEGDRDGGDPDGDPVRVLDHECSDIRGRLDAGEPVDADLGANPGDWRGGDRAVAGIAGPRCRGAGGRHARSGAGEGQQISADRGLGAQGWRGSKSAIPGIGLASGCRHRVLGQLTQDRAEGKGRALFDRNDLALDVGVEFVLQHIPQGRGSG